MNVDTIWLSVFFMEVFESEKIKVVGGDSEVLDDLIAATPEENSIFVLPSYTAMLDFRNELVKRNLTHAFWEDGQ